MPALALEYTYAYRRPSALLPDGRRHCLSLVTGSPRAPASKRCPGNDAFVPGDVPYAADAAAGDGDDAGPDIPGNTRGIVFGMVKHSDK